MAPTKETLPSPIFFNKSATPESLPPSESSKLILEAIERLQQVERASMGKDEIVKGVAVNKPIHVYIVGDQHLGSIATDHQAVLNLRDQILNDPLACVISVGDEIEGLTAKYMDTNAARTPIDAQQQINLVKDIFFQPLAQQGKILCLVGGYFGHPGWLQDATTIDPQILMADVRFAEEYLRERQDFAARYGIQVLGNGGTLHLDFPGGHRQSFRVWHNPPGKSKNDPVYGLREVAIRESDTVRSNAYVAGHLHRAGIAQEMYAGSQVPVVLIASGTAKGSSPDVPRDRFGQKLGLGPTDGLGQGVIIIPRHRGDRYDRNYPFLYQRQGSTAAAALDLLDAAERQHLTTDLIGQIHAKEAAPQIELLTRESRTVRSNSPHKEDLAKPTTPPADPEGDAPTDFYKGDLQPLYDSLSYHIATSLPVALHLVANARIGSSVEGFQRLKEYQKNLIANNPHALVIYLRNMIDKSVASQPDRQLTVNRFAKLIIPSQTVALLLDESLHVEAWKKSVGRAADGSSNPFPPGSYLSKATNTPLIHNLSLVKFAIGPQGISLTDKPLYVGAFTDRLQGRGSRTKPTHGLLSMYQEEQQRKPGFLVGGHMPNAGTAMFPDPSNTETNYPILVAPGWWAGYVNAPRRGDEKVGSLPGQGIILMPGTTKGDYLAFPTVNDDQTRYMHDALFLLKGLELLGIDPNSILSR